TRPSSSSRTAPAASPRATRARAPRIGLEPVDLEGAVGFRGPDAGPPRRFHCRWTRILAQWPRCARPSPARDQRDERLRTRGPRRLPILEPVPPGAGGAAPRRVHALPAAVLLVLPVRTGVAGHPGIPGHGGGDQGGPLAPFRLPDARVPP